MFIKFPSIEQFRHVIKDVSQTAKHHEVEKPTIQFNGSVKLHGTNAGVSFYQGQIFAQSRSRIITVEDDNAGFAKFVAENKNDFMTMFNQIGFAKDNQVYTIFGEWCGGNIQKGVALNQLDKMFVIFGIVVTYDTPDKNGNTIQKWLSLDSVKIPLNDSIHAITKSPTYTVNVDFNRPELAQDAFYNLTMEVEKECPFCKTFGVSGIGEGIVWTAEWMGKRFMFKTKGDKHSSSKVIKVASVDVEKVNSILEFVEYAATENRMQQAIKEVFGDNEPDIKKMGDFIRWLFNDVIKEESDTLEKAGLTIKDVSKEISNKARIFFNKNY